MEQIRRMGVSSFCLSYPHIQFDNLSTLGTIRALSRYGTRLGQLMHGLPLTRGVLMVTSSPLPINESVIFKICSLPVMYLELNVTGLHNVKGSSLSVHQCYTRGNRKRDPNTKLSLISMPNKPPPPKKKWQLNGKMCRIALQQKK